MIDYSSKYNVLRMQVIRDCISRTKPGKSVVEFGCGTGNTTSMLLDHNEHVTAIDSNADALESARILNKNRNALFYDHDLNRPLPAKFEHFFDSAVALEVIEHLDNPEVFIEDIKRCLRPNGMLLLSTPNLTSPEALIGRFWAWREGKRYEAWDKTHKHLFTAGNLLRLLKAKGFIPIRIVGYHYDTDKLPIARIRLRMPLHKAAFWPLNRLGFNIIILARVVANA